MDKEEKENNRLTLENSPDIKKSLRDFKNEYNVKILRKTVEDAIIILTREISHLFLLGKEDEKQIKTDTRAEAII